MEYRGAVSSSLPDHRAHSRTLQGNHTLLRPASYELSTTCRGPATLVTTTRSRTLEACLVRWLVYVLTGPFGKVRVMLNEPAGLRGGVILVRHRATRLALATQAAARVMDRATVTVSLVSGAPKSAMKMATELEVAVACRRMAMTVAVRHTHQEI